ncbi:metallophosphoesterase family protein [Microcoleus asticus]|uniref:3',5'-cyclic adenosine monophosphate phosphodiesterase CpdA n=2 Tax=Microcoleus TaxID=44471 RepID=A0ABX2D3F1_9CYAN|nr:metallophosphoesterase family protein [Microcoleus asticus]NQE37165.1 3',5'-cyclic adenosine monophosphate phosphodiesterase CpdA [Microcoleus asticus IPMA8]
MITNKNFNIIGVIGDIHAEEQLLDKTVAFLNSQNVDNILCVGDIVDGSGDANQCCNILKREEILVVLGNHDRWLLKNEMRSLKEATQPDSLSVISQSFLISLPSTIEFPTPHGLALLCHGIGENDMARLNPDDYGYAIEVNIDIQNLIRGRKYRYVINGHTHYKMVRHFGNLTIINAGTLKHEHEPGFLVIDFVQQFVQFYKFFEDAGIEEAERVSLTAVSCDLGGFTR